MAEAEVDDDEDVGSWMGVDELEAAAARRAERPGAGPSGLDVEEYLDFDSSVASILMSRGENLLGG